MSLRRMAPSSACARREGDELFADVVVACDGANSIIGQKAGLVKREWRSDEIALGVKEILALPAPDDPGPL